MQRYCFIYFSIKNANLSNNLFVSYNVTNIPLQETIDTAIFNHNPNLKITKKIKKLYLFATSQTHFVFNSMFYNQIEEVAMGSLLATVLANFLMVFYKSKRLNEYNLDKPKFFKDMLVTF